MKNKKKITRLLCISGLITMLGASNFSALVYAVSPETDNTLTDISQSVKWEVGSFDQANGRLTFAQNNNQLRTVASFGKRLQVYIETKPGYSYRISETLIGGDGAYWQDRRFGQTVKYPYGKWMKSGYFNTYDDREYVIEIKKDDGGKVELADVNNIIGLSEVDVINHIPEYYNQYMNDKIDVINNLQELPGSFSFVFVTDPHMQYNTKHSAPIIKEIVKRCGITDVIGGGDQVTGWNYDWEGKQSILNDYEELDRYFSGMNMIKTPGNHDWAWGSYNQFNLTEPEFNPIYFEDELERTDLVWNDNGDPTWYFYKDDPVNKMRYIMLNDNDYEIETNADGTIKGNNKAYNYFIEQPQLDWLKNVALVMPDDEWTCAIFTHVPGWDVSDYGKDVDRIEGRQAIRSMLRDFKDKKGEFASYKGDFIGWIAGHMHADSMMTLNDKKIISSVTSGDCADREPGTPPRDPNTISEQCFDIMTVDKINKRVYLTRFGAGEDRSFDYKK